MIKAVIIDFDDTLCMTEAACFALENEVLRRMGRPPMEHAAYLKTWGRPIFEVMPERSPGIDLKAFETVYDIVCQEFIADGRLDTVPPQNYAVLDRLMAADKHLMVLTSRTHTEFKHMLAPDSVLAARVTAFYYRDNMQFHKPDPRAFAELLTQHQLQPTECVYVGDSISDAQAAAGAGIAFIACLESGLRTQQDFAGLPVAAFIAAFADLDQAVAAVDKAKSS